jgi:transposase
VPKLRSRLPRIQELLAATPDMTLAELRAELRVTVALSTLWAAVRSLGLTFKKVTRAAERDRPDVAAARDKWRRDAAPALDPHSVVFVDETAANTQMDRRYGYAPRGQPVVGTVPHGHYKSLTFTAALRANGLTATQVLDGPMTGPRFREYVTTRLVPTLRPGDVVVMDNLPCHKAGAVRAAVEAAGCRLLYLPPYSPDLNPIELAFARLKRLLRSDGHRDVPTLMTFLGSVRTAFRADECRAYLRHCGYGQPTTTPPLKRH